MRFVKQWTRVPLLLGVLTLSLWPPSAFAQVTTADVVGTVSDSSGGLLPGVTITARNDATGNTETVVTDSGGNFQILRLAPGRYRVTAALQGFKTVDNEVTLAIGDRFRLSLKLEIGSVEEHLTVTGQAPLLQTETTSVAVLVDERAMQDLPLNGRNFIRLAQLTPGATEGPSNALSSGNRPDDRRQSSAIAVNGQDTSQNNFLIDGLDNNERFIGTVIIRPQVDSIREMRIETSSFSAELGRTAGGIINVVTKSGTNVMHGSAFEFYRNETMDSKNFFAKSIDKPRYDQNQFGGSIGGPLVKDKTFFFADYAGLRLKQGETRTSTVPSMALRTGNFAGRNTIYDPSTGLPFPGNVIPQNRIDSAARNLVNLWPEPTSPSATNNFVYAPVKTQEDDSFDIRLDHRINAENSLFARYSYNNARTFFPDSLPPVNGITPGGLGNTVFPGSSKQKPQAIQVNFDRVVSPTFIMEMKGGFSRYDAATNHSNFGINASEQMGIPGINIDDDSSGLSRIIVAPFVDLGDAGFIPLVIVNDLIQGAVSMTYVSGGNTLKAGVDLKSREVLGSQSPTARGTFTFNGNFTSNAGATGTGDPFASFLLGLPSSTERSKYLVAPYLSDEGSRHVPPVRPPCDRLVDDQRRAPLGPLHGVHRKGRPDREPRHGSRQHHRCGREWRFSCGQRRERHEQLLAAFRLGGHDQPADGPPRRLRYQLHAGAARGWRVPEPAIYQPVEHHTVRVHAAEPAVSGSRTARSHERDEPDGQPRRGRVRHQGAVRPPVQHRAAARTEGQRGGADRLRRHPRA